MKQKKIYNNPTSFQVSCFSPLWFPKEDFTMSNKILCNTNNSSDFWNVALITVYNMYKPQSGFLTVILVNIERTVIKIQKNSNYLSNKTRLIQLVYAKYSLSYFVKFLSTVAVN